jgi:hypothetical protein
LLGKDASYDLNVKEELQVVPERMPYAKPLSKIASRLSKQHPLLSNHAMATIKPIEGRTVRKLNYVKSQIPC